jgi:dephospho-CoA kinase
MNGNKLVIGLVGMPGSGKSFVVETAQEKGYEVVVMGDIVREETRRRGLELNPTNIGVVMLDLRKTGGTGVIAEKCVPNIKAKKSKKIIVDGLRSLDEADVFKTHFPSFTLIAVHASPETRFSRLNRRRRSDDPDGWEVFRERDSRELSVGLGNAIAMAEHMVINENAKQEVKAKVAEILAWVEKQWQN